MDLIVVIYLHHPYLWYKTRVGCSLIGLCLYQKIEQFRTDTMQKNIFLLVFVGVVSDETVDDGGWCVVIKTYS